MAIKISGTTVIDNSRNLTNINGLAQSTWEAGTSTTETVVSPAKVKAVIDSLSEGGTTLITSTTISSATAVDFTAFDSSLYDGYFFYLHNVRPSSTGQVSLFMSVSTNGGSTFVTTADLAYVGQKQNEDNTFTNISSGGATTIVELARSVSGTAGRGLSGQVWISDPSANSSTKINFFSVFQDGGNVLNKQNGTGVYKNTTEVNAIRFSCNFGGIADGVINMYGLKKQ